MEVHICVDGYSWLIVYAHCPDNNHAETVLDQFAEGVDRYELPSRVRSEHGMENFGVVQYKLERRENFGVAQYKLERRENFGVAQYKLERRENFGVAQYKLERRENFGVAQCKLERRENFGVAQYKLERRELNRESIITGSSVHNSRVEFEIAHRDVYSGVLSFFSRTFTELEDSGILDPLHDAHICTLHKVFIPLINRRLVSFKMFVN